MRNTASNEIALRILRLFGEPDAEGWDLHAFFELVAGDDRKGRMEVFDVVDRLVECGYLESQGSDFYTITKEGVRAARTGSVDLR
jgi:hypothetical protein